MAKIVADHSQAAFQSLATNSLSGAVFGAGAAHSEPVITTVSKNADSSAVRDPLK